MALRWGWLLSSLVALIPLSDPVPAVVAQVPTDILHWEAGVNTFAQGWWRWCFGTAGYHRGAADVFPDAEAPCGALGGGPVVVDVWGYTWRASPYAFSARVVQSVSGGCQVLNVELWLEPFGHVATEQYWHAVAGSSNGTTFPVALGSWQWVRSGTTLWGSSLVNDGCIAGPAPYHVHMASLAPGKSVRTNGQLRPDTVYPVPDNVWVPDYYWVHAWEW